MDNKPPVSSNQSPVLQIYSLSKSKLTSLSLSTNNLKNLTQIDLVNDLNVLKLTSATSSSDCGFMVLVYPAFLKVISNAHSQNKLKIDLKNITFTSFLANNIFVAFRPYNSSIPQEPSNFENENLYIIEIEHFDEKLDFKVIKKSEHKTNSFSVEDLVYSELNNLSLRRLNNQTIEKHYFETKESKVVSVGNVSKLSAPKNKQNIACFIKGDEKKNVPSSLKMYDIGLNITKTRKSFFNLDDVKFNWNNKGNKVLCIGQSDFDTTGKSYYGESKLFYLTEEGKYDCKIPLGGPVYAVQWSPASSEFIVLYGFMPSHMVMYNTKVETIKTMNKVSKNHARYSIDGKYFSLSGFGSLNGNIDIYRRSTFSKIASIPTRATSQMEFACNDVIVTATLHRNLKVDNAINIYSIYGDHLHSIKYDQLDQIMLHGTALYCVDSSIKQTLEPKNSTATNAKPTLPKKYTPPHARNSGGVLPNTMEQPASTSITIEKEETKREIEKLEKRLMKATRLRSKLINEGIQLNEKEKKLVNSSSEILFRIDGLKRKL